MSFRSRAEFLLSSHYACLSFFRYVFVVVAIDKNVSRGDIHSLRVARKQGSLKTTGQVGVLLADSTIIAPPKKTAIFFKNVSWSTRENTLLSMKKHAFMNYLFAKDEYRTTMSGRQRALLYSRRYCREPVVKVLVGY